MAHAGTGWNWRAISRTGAGMAPGEKVTQTDGDISKSNQDPTKVMQNSPSPLLSKGISFFQEHISHLFHPFKWQYHHIMVMGLISLSESIRYSSTFPNVTWVKIMSFKVSLSLWSRLVKPRPSLVAHGLTSERATLAT